MIECNCDRCCTRVNGNRVYKFNIKKLQGNSIVIEDMYGFLCPDCYDKLVKFLTVKKKTNKEGE